MDRRRAQLIDRVETSGQDFLWCLNQLEEIDMFTPPSPGEWTVHQVAAHMRDTEQQVFLLRVERVMNEVHPAVTNFDQVEWNREHYLPSEPLRKVNSEFRSARRKLVRLLRRSTKREWDNWAVHPSLGKISLDWILEHCYFHTLEHIAQMGRLREGAILRKLND